MRFHCLSLLVPRRGPLATLLAALLALGSAVLGVQNEALAVEPGMAAANSVSGGAAAMPRQVAQSSSSSASPSTVGLSRDSARAEAAVRYERGLRLYGEGDFQLAVIEFERAYDLVPNYRVLYNIGQVRLQLGEFARARRSLEKYLEQADSAIATERRQEVEQDLRMLEQRTALLRLDISVTGAEVFIDDLPVGVSDSTAPLLIDAGERQITVRKPGYEVYRRRIELASSDGVVVRIDLQPAAPKTQVVGRSDRGESRRAWKWSSWTASGVLLVGSATTGILGSLAASDLEELRETPGASRSELDSASRRAEGLLLSADLLGGLALVAAGVGAYLSLAEPEPPEDRPMGARSSQLSLSITPARLRLSARF